MRYCLFLILVWSNFDTYSQNLPKTVKGIDSLTLPIKVENINSIPDTTLNNSFVETKSCILSNKDTLHFYLSFQNNDLIQVTRVLYNTNSARKLEKHEWSYYFFKNELVLVFNFNITDYGRVYSYSKYYFYRNKCFYPSGYQNKQTGIANILAQGKIYLKQAKNASCR